MQEAHCKQATNSINRDFYDATGSEAPQVEYPETCNVGHAELKLPRIMHI